MCDQGHELLFNSRECRIWKQESRMLTATATRTPNNIYLLDKIESEKCHLGKEDESWIWHRRMGHIHFDNLVKICKNQAFRNILEVTNPLTLYVNTVSMENKQEYISRQKSIILQNLWSSFTLTYVNQPRENE